ncbi:PH domain-containing protein [Demequina sp. B12]|uniref:PH domain-containing protein n=1 Tax=Demequina sp. B12 TaxID=2992757 RepID=UPI00237B7738|nr:PH domain-containing protein [Demequina sp. B12]MDE0571872.1 PH domain-containing protein [Demequina sp. B12]
MLTHTRTVGLAHGRQSLSAESRRASGGTIVAIVVALLAGIYFVATAPTPQERVAPGAIAVLAIASGLLALKDHRDIARGRVTLRQPPGFQFTRRLSTCITEATVGAIAIATGFAVALTGDDADSLLQTFEGWLGALLVAVGAGMCAYALISIARRTGLRIDQNLVTYRTAFRTQSARWEQVEGVTVSGTYPYLRLVIDGSGRTLTVSSRAIGSDPSAVAAIIDFYRQHPGHRHHLTDADAAITWVEQTHTAVS